MERSSLSHWLKWEFFPGVYQRFPVDRDLTIGRDAENAIAIPDGSVSLQHAMVGREGDRVWIEDLGSTNGILIGGNMVKKKYLEDGDLVTVGYVDLLFSSERSSDFVVDLEHNELPVEEIRQQLVNRDSVLFLLSTEKTQIQKLCELLRLSVQGIWPERDAGEFSKSIEEAIENAATHGNQGEAGKKLRCRYERNERRVAFCVADEGRGFDFRTRLQSVLDGQHSGGLSRLRAGVDRLEFNREGSEIWLVKQIEKMRSPEPASPPKAQEPAPSFAERMRKAVILEPGAAGHPGKIREPRQVHLTIRYAKEMAVEQDACFEAVVSQERCKTFPDHLPASSGWIDTEESESLGIQPVFPGCLCVPPHREIDASRLPMKVKFWLTPLHAHPCEEAHVEILSKGQVLRSAPLARQVADTRKSRLLLAMALWTPLLFLLLDVSRIVAWKGQGLGIGNWESQFALTSAGVLLGAFFLFCKVRISPKKGKPSLVHETVEI